MKTLIITSSLPEKSTVDALKAQGHTLFFASSAAKSQILAWQESLGISEPFVAESGAALFFPQRYANFNLSAYPPCEGHHCVPFGKPGPFIQAYLKNLQDKYTLWETWEEAQNSLHVRDFSALFSLPTPEIWEVLNEEAKLYGLSITPHEQGFCCMGKTITMEGALQTATAIFRRNGIQTQFQELAP